MAPAFEVNTRAINEETHEYFVTRSGQSLSYAEAIGLWQNDAVFRAFFISLLSDSPFTAYRWETPSITNGTANRPFQFVLLNSPGLSRVPDHATFAQQFADAGIDGVVVFENLSKDSTLIVPAAESARSAFDHLAAFIRSASEKQKHALWQAVGLTMQSKISAKPLWLSTAGGGVAWLHVRLDSRPKYYGYGPYREG